jgi:ribosome-binding factor A
MKLTSFPLPSLCGIIMATTLFEILIPSTAFSIAHIKTKHTHRSTSLQPLQAYGRSSPISSRDRSKRQERVGHVVRTEIASIIQLGYQIKNSNGFIDDDLRRRINIVNADVSPDLRQARITVSIIKPTRRVVVEEEEDEFDDEDFVEPKKIFPDSRAGDAVVDRRRAYSWLVKNTKQIRHALSQRLSHMKTIPNLTFVQADVGAAVDVMNLIEKVSNGDYKRENLGKFGGEDDKLPEGMYLESELEGDGWLDDDFDDFDWEEDEEDDDEEEEEPISDKKK